MQNTQQQRLNTTQRTKYSFDLGAVVAPSLSNRIISRPYAFDHTIFIDEVLVEPADWRQELDLIRTAGPDDVFHFQINSCGGNIAVLVAFLTAMKASVAHFVGYLNYEACSAASVLLLECDNWVIAEDGMFMIHNSSTGYGGKSNNLTDYALFNDDHSRKLLTKYYEDFLTLEEMEDVLKGVELWLSGEELVKRLNARQEARLAKEEKAKEQEKEAAVIEGEDNTSEEEEWPLAVAMDEADISFDAPEAHGELEANQDFLVTTWGVAGKHFFFNKDTELFNIYGNMGEQVWCLDPDVEAWCFTDDVTRDEVVEACDWLGIKVKAKDSKKTLIAKMKSFVNDVVDRYGE